MREQGHPPLEVCQLARGEEWRGCSAIGIEVTASQGQGERDERERGGRRGKGGGECGGRRTTPGEGTLQEGGGAHALLTRARRRQVAKGLGRAAQPVLALTCVLTDVNTVGQIQSNVCLYSGGEEGGRASSAQQNVMMNIFIFHLINLIKFMIVESG